jgi:hypothetical protein
MTVIFSKENFHYKILMDYSQHLLALINGLSPDARLQTKQSLLTLLQAELRVNTFVTMHPELTSIHQLLTTTQLPTLPEREIHYMRLRREILEGNFIAFAITAAGGKVKGTSIPCLHEEYQVSRDAFEEQYNNYIVLLQPDPDLHGDNSNIPIDNCIYLLRRDHLDEYKLCSFQHKQQQVELYEKRACKGDKTVPKYIGWEMTARALENCLRGTQEMPTTTTLQRYTPQVE